MKWLTSVGRLVTAFWGGLLDLVGLRRQYRAEVVEDLPDILKKDTVYLIGEDDQCWFAALKCPCGCNETIQLNMIPPTRPLWRHRQEKDGTVTLHPSVWRKTGCRSHFIMREGQVIWCGKNV